MFYIFSVKSFFLYGSLGLGKRWVPSQVQTSQDGDTTCSRHCVLHIIHSFYSIIWYSINNIDNCNIDLPLIIVIYIFGKYNHPASTYQNSSHYYAVHFYAKRQKEHPLSNISEWQSISSLKFPFHMHPNIKYQSINIIIISFSSTILYQFIILIAGSTLPHLSGINTSHECLCSCGSYVFWHHFVLSDITALK